MGGPAGDESSSVASRRPCPALSLFLVFSNTTVSSSLPSPRTCARRPRAPPGRRPRLAGYTVVANVIPIGAAVGGLRGRVLPAHPTTGPGASPLVPQSQCRAALGPMAKNNKKMTTVSRNKRKREGQSSGTSHLHCLFVPARRADTTSSAITTPARIITHADPRTLRLYLQSVRSPRVYEGAASAPLRCTHSKT